MGKHNLYKNIICFESFFNSSKCHLSPIYSLNVIAVAEASAHIAKNRACGLAVAIFHRCPDSLVKVQEISKVLNKSDLSKKEEKEEEVQHEEQEQNSNSTISATTTSNTTTNEESLKKTDVNK